MGVHLFVEGFDLGLNFLVLPEDAAQHFVLLVLVPGRLVVPGPESLLVLLDFLQSVEQLQHVLAVLEHLLVHLHALSSGALPFELVGEHVGFVPAFIDDVLQVFFLLPELLDVFCEPFGLFAQGVDGAVYPASL